MADKVIVLGEREYPLTQKPIRQTREWQNAARVPLDELIGAITVAVTMDLSNLSNLTTMAGLGRTILNVLAGSTDLMLELVLTYIPEAAADREYIEENAYYTQAQAALVDILMVVFPLGTLARSLGLRSPSTFQS